MHAHAEEFERQRAGQADQPGDDGGDQEADDEPVGEPDHGLASVAGPRARVRTSARN